MDNKPINRLRSKRFWYSLMPLLLMIGIIIAVNLLSPSPPRPEPEGGGEAATAVMAQADSPAVTTTRPPILQATILPSPTPTITPRPNVAPSANITLFGPPEESFFPLTNPIAFYWTYSEMVAAGQEFLFTIHQNETVVYTAVVSHPNVGELYQATVNLEEPIVPGTIEWRVSLQWQDEMQPLLTSETRSLTLLPES